MATHPDQLPPSMPPSPSDHAIHAPDPVPSTYEDERTAEHDLCRICRSEGSIQDPLYHPCKCSGSIKYVHQDCLKEWLSHSQKKHCELCKTPFRFTKYYSPDMPETLPAPLFLRQALLHAYHELLKTCRGILVASVWLFWLPWSMRQVFWGLFWIADGGWAQDLNSSLVENSTQVVASATIEPSATLAAQSSSPSTFFSFERLQSHLRLISNIMTLGEHVFDASDAVDFKQNISIAGVSPQDNDSLLSGFAFFRNLTPNPAINRFVTDVLEGQIITLSVVVAFVLVFLIREWVVQQQPHAPAVEVLPALDAQQHADHVAEEPEQAAVRRVELVDLLRDAGLPDAEAADLLQTELPQDLTTDADSAAYHSDQALDSGDDVAATTTSSNSGQSWQHLIDDAASDRDITGSVERASSERLAPPHPTILEPPAAPTAEDLPHNDDMHMHDRVPEIDETMHSIFAPSSAEREALAAAVAHLPTTNEVPDGPASQLHRGYIDLFWDWLFADLDTVERPLMADQGLRPLPNAGQEAPVELIDDAPAEQDTDDDEDDSSVGIGDVAEERVEPDVNNAADDLEPVEDDLEDIEGLLELIGMQGPLVGLFQNAVFCSILISTTVTVAVWFPYLWGKLVLLFLAHPFQLTIKMPLALITWTCNFIVDVGLYLGCIFLIQVDWLGRLALIPLAWVFPSLTGLSKHNAISTAIQSVGDSAIGRISDLLLASAELPVSDFYHLSVSSHAALQSLSASSKLALCHSFEGLLWLFTHFASFKDGRTALRNVVPAISAASYRLSNLPHDLAFHLASAFDASTDTLLAVDSTFLHNSSSVSSVDSFVNWSATDRFLAVSAGYMFFAIAGTLYVRAGPPLTAFEQIQKLEAIVAEVLRQAGGVLKVILIISIEMLLFPLYCGFLLDVAVLPLFNATIMSRIQYTLASPWSACFLHWFIGTCYMFHFALFVSMCRKLLRGGVLYFIRDPDDPTFHPVRDVLERSIATQLRKIGFSALVYGLLVICCLGSVVWTTSYITQGLFPIQWTSSVPRLEFPIDLILYHTLTPIAMHLLKPAAILEGVYGWWFRRCGHALRLSHFLFGDESDQSGETGKWVRAPSSDQVRIPKGTSVFLVVDKDNNRLDGQPDDEDDKGPHGKANKHFAKVFIPSCFRARIGLFVLCIWALTAASGLALTLAPLIFGRFMLGRLIGLDQEVNDVHAFSIAATVLALAGFALQSRARVVEAFRSFRTSYSSMMNTIEERALQGAKRAVVLVYFYSALALWIPSILALLLQLYFILPLHTYVQLRNNARIVTPTTIALHANELNRSDTAAYNQTQIDLAGPVNVLSQTQQNRMEPTYTIHALQSWILGLFFTRILIRLFLTRFSTSRPTRALQAVVARGWLNPDARIATKCFIVPITVLGSLAILVPAVSAQLVNVALTHHVGNENLPTLSSSSLFTFLLWKAVSFAKTLTNEEVTRLAYPAVSMLGLGVLSVLTFVKGVRKWRRKIRDEVYLVGERLHNYGEAKPPQASAKSNKGKGRAVEAVEDNPGDRVLTDKDEIATGITVSDESASLNGVVR